MANDLSIIQTVNLSIARIVYHTDLQRADVAPIPLGVIAEVTGGPFRGLGLIARADLLPQELASVGRLMRESLARPFEFLKLQFEWAAAETHSGEALRALAARHTESLFFSPPVAQTW